MNAERLHVVIQGLIDDLTTTELPGGLQSLRDALQRQVQEPTAEAHQQTVSRELEKLRDSLTEAPSNDFSPTWRQVLEQIGAEELLGAALLSRVEEAFARNQVTPATALVTLGELHQEVTNLQATATGLLNGLEAFNIGAEELDPGEVELGVLVPREAVDNQLQGFGKELIALDKLFGTFAEVATGSRDGFEIRTISTSDLTVFLDIGPVVGACIAHAVERIVSLYKSVLEIRKLRSELANQNVPSDKLAGVEDHANTMMTDGIELLVEELFKKYAKKRLDSGRKNELKIALRFGLNQIANKLDKGYNIEVRVEPIVAEDGDDEEGDGSIRNEHVDTILSAGEAMQFFKREGEPILALPEKKERAPRAQKKNES